MVRSSYKIFYFVLKELKNNWSVLLNTVDYFGFLKLIFWVKKKNMLLCMVYSTTVCSLSLFLEVIFGRVS